jgi:hypothetical protein
MDWLQSKASCEEEKRCNYNWDKQDPACSSPCTGYNVPKLPDGVTPDPAHACVSFCGKPGMTEEVSEVPRCKLEKEMWPTMDRCWMETESYFNQLNQEAQVDRD